MNRSVFFILLWVFLAFTSLEYWIFLQFAAPIRDYYPFFTRFLFWFLAAWNLAIIGVLTYLLKQRFDSALSATRQQLEKQDHLAGLGTLSAGIAHEIKNALNFILNFSALSVSLASELMAALRGQESKLDPEAAAHSKEALATLQLNVQKINDHGTRANQVVTHMLRHARGNGGPKEDIQLELLIKEYLSLAYHSQRVMMPGFTVQVQEVFPPGLKPVKGVPHELGRVFLNLFNNAFYAMAQKRLSTSEYTPVLSVRASEAADHIHVIVEDNGPGISPAALPHVFEPFFTTKPSSEGTGLGLSVSLKIVEAHGGKISVESQLGVFTRFHLIL